MDDNASPAEVGTSEGLGPASRRHGEGKPVAHGARLVLDIGPGAGEGDMSFLRHGDTAASLTREFLCIRDEAKTRTAYSQEELKRAVDAAVAAERKRLRVLLVAQRDQTVMSHHVTLAECHAARNALQLVLDEWA
jgi:hypothetical protein